MSDLEKNHRESQLSALYDGELPQAERELVARRLSRDENLRRSWENYALIGAVMRRESLAGDRLVARVAAGIAAQGAAAQDPPPADVARGAVASGGDPRDAAPLVMPPKEMPPRMPRWAVPASGLGLAAGIAVVGVFGVLWLGSPLREPVATASMLPQVAGKVDEIIIPAAPSVGSAPNAESATEKPAARVLMADNSAAATKPAGNGEPLSYVTPPLKSAAASEAPFALAGYVGAHSAVSAPMLRHSAISAVIAVDALQSVETAPIAAPGGANAAADATEPAR